MADTSISNYRACTKAGQLHIEIAGQLIYGQIGVGIDGHAMAALPAGSCPLLKIHGCRICDRANMVWAPGQLGQPPVSDRIAFSRDWLAVRLLDRDLLIVGFWTDWDYLNEVLASTLGTVHPARVLVVNPTDAADLPSKAPPLAALGAHAKIGFKHVKVTGGVFLRELRAQFSRSFIRRVLHGAAAEFKDVRGAVPDAAWLEPPTLENEVMWEIRRDLEGCLPRQPAQLREPPAEPLLGLTLLQLLAAGAVPDGPYWNIGGRRVRVLRASNKPLHRVEAEFLGATAPAIAPDLTIAVGAEAQALPISVARAATPATIARGGKSAWMTRPDAIKELGL